MSDSYTHSFEIEKRGYNIEEVDNYIEDLHAKIKYLQTEKNELEQKLDSARRMIRSFSEEENALRQSIADSKNAAVTMMQDTQARSETLLDKTRETCSEIITDLDTKIEAKMKVVDDMKDAVADFKNELFKLYSEHIELIEGLADKAEEFTYVPDYSGISAAVDEFEATDTTSFTPPVFNDYPQESIFAGAEAFEKHTEFDMSEDKLPEIKDAENSQLELTIAAADTEQNKANNESKAEKLPAFETEVSSPAASALDEESFRFLNDFANADDE